MARTVTDAAILLGALTGEDPRDPATAASKGHALTDYTKFLDKNGLAGARIGVPRPHYFGYSPNADKLVNDAIELMRAAGAIIVDPAPIATAREMDDPEFEVLLYEFKADLNAYLADLGSGRERAHARRSRSPTTTRTATAEMPFFGQELFLKAQAKGPLTDQAYLDALAKCRRLSRTEGIDATMDKYNLDALVAPTNGPPTADRSRERRLRQRRQLHPGRRRRLSAASPCPPATPSDSPPGSPSSGAPGANRC